MKDKPKFLMLCGLVASGKSTLAEELSDRDDTVLISSDSIREELIDDVNDQSKNSEVFNEMRVRTIEALKNGKSVIYDSTNINRKRRKGLLQQLPKDVYKVVVYMNTPYDIILKQNQNRNRIVPEHVIKKMYKTMHIPIYSEGWDNVIFEHHSCIVDNTFPAQFSEAVKAGVMFGREGYDLMKFMSTYFDEFFTIYDMPHDSFYHSFSVSRHTYYAYKCMLDNYNDTNHKKQVMLWSALFHDVGKGVCKSFTNYKGEETRFASFIGHSEVSSQIACNILCRLGFDDKFIHDVTTIIQFHMYLLDGNASRDRLRRYVGEDIFKQLEIMRDADKQAH